MSSTAVAARAAPKQPSSELASAADLHEELLDLEITLGGAFFDIIELVKADFVYERHHGSIGAWRAFHQTLIKVLKRKTQMYERKVASEDRQRRRGGVA